MGIRVCMRGVLGNRREHCSQRTGHALLDEGLFLLIFIQELVRHGTTEYYGYR